MKSLKAKLIFSLLYLLSLLPFPILYLLSDFLYVVLYHFIGYRKGVVINNLSRSFPDKNDDEIKQITKQFYHHLADIFLESIKSFSISKQEVQRRMKMIEPQNFTAQKKEGLNVVVAFGHCGNWEWFGLSGSSQSEPNMNSLYRQIKDPILNELIHKNRARFGLGLVPEKKAHRLLPGLLNSSDEWNLVGFLADQSANPRHCVWVDFLHQKTNFVKGPFFYAKRYNVPVLFYSIKKIKRGFYEGRSEVLIADPSLYTVEQMTAMFAIRLEQQINEQPFNWLWSHKRWKHEFKGKS